MKKLILFTLFIPIVLVPRVHAQTTYTVTSNSIDGPGSFIEAVDLANNNPGADIIQFTPSLQVDAAIATSGSADQYLVQVTESVVINGNGATLKGIQSWVTAAGVVNSLTECPGSDPTTRVFAQMPNFLRVGTLGQDNSSVEVTINDLTIEKFNQVARLEQNSTLTLDDFVAIDTWATLACNQKALIEVASGASLNLLNSKFNGFKNWGSVGLGVISSEADAGDLLIEKSYFFNLNYGFSFLVSWDGKTGSKINIISSRVIQSGGLLLLLNGEAVTNIVNSTWTNDPFSNPKFSERFINQSQADLNFIASSIMWNNYICDAACQQIIDAGNDFYMFNRKASGKINFEGTAVGFNINAGSIETLHDDSSNGFSADIYTFIQATTAQDASALQTITNQANLITNVPAFNSPIFSSLDTQDIQLLNPSFPGELIDIIPSTETLLHPITNSPITVDVIGNDRFDANGFRDIGAIQLALAPLLIVTDTGDQLVEIAWQEPLHHDGEPIVRYEYQYVESSGGSPTIVDVGLSLSANVTGLTNGTSYDFSVRAVYDESGTEVNGPFSNINSGVPTGALSAPTLTAAPLDGEVGLSWNLPNLNGKTFSAYVISWQIDGDNSTEYTTILDENTTGTLIENLINDTTYNFTIKVLTTDGSQSPEGTASATPNASLSLDELTLNEVFIYPNPARNILKIDLENENYIIRLFSLDGKMIIESQNKKSIDLTKISSGHYIINIQTDNRIYSGKIIKQ